MFRPKTWARRARADDGRYTIKTGAPTGILHRLTGWALEWGIDLEEMAVSAPTLEDVFIELVGATEQGDGEE